MANRKQYSDLDEPVPLHETRSGSGMFSLVSRSGLHDCLSLQPSVSGGMVSHRWERERRTLATRAQTHWVSATSSRGGVAPSGTTKAGDPHPTAPTEDRT